MNFSVIIVAAGSSQRMGFDKLLANLAGKPVLQHSIEAFANCPGVTEIVVVCPHRALQRPSPRIKRYTHHSG